jgi:hypothetical protein
MASKMVAETVSKMARGLLSSSASTKGLKMASTMTGRLVSSYASQKLLKMAA